MCSSIRRVESYIGHAWVTYVEMNYVCMYVSLSLSLDHCVYHYASLRCNNGSLSTSITSAEYKLFIRCITMMDFGMVLSSQNVMCASDGHCIVQNAVHISTGESINIYNS
jgi:hypothetical protein